MTRFYYPVLCSLVILLTSCHTYPPRIQLAHQEIFAFAKEVKQEHNLQLICYGGGFIEHINTLSLSFLGNQKLDVDASRALFVDLSQRFISRINQNEEISPYLAEHPFTAMNLEFVILFPSYSRSEFPKYVSSIGITNVYNFDKKPVVVLYTADDAEDFSSVVIFRETYEEALQRAWSWQQ